MTPQIAGGGAACNCFASNQTGLCSASDPDQTIGDDCECFNKGQAEDQRCQVNKRHKILLNEKDSPHQCSLIIESATKADIGRFKIYSNYGGHQISECSLVVNESPQADHKHALPSWVVVAIVIPVVLLTAAIVVLVCMYVKAKRQANHQNLDPASNIELSPLNQHHDASQVANTGTDNDDDPERSTPSTCQAV